MKATNSDLLVSISLQPVTFQSIRLFDLTELKVWNINNTALGFKDIRIRKSEFVAFINMLKVLVRTKEMTSKSIKFRKFWKNFKN